jgi:hypothetical protein
MKPIKFKGSNTIFAKNQKPYLPLPAWVKSDDEKGTTVCCWQANLIERLKILFTGKLYVSLLSFNKPLTPNRVYAENPIKYFVNQGEL